MKKIAFQTNYGNIFIFNIEKPHNLVKFMPTKNLKNQFEFEDLYHMKTDGNIIISFDAKSGYKSHSDSSNVYNTYEYNLETNEVIQTTNHNFIYP